MNEQEQHVQSAFQRVRDDAPPASPDWDDVLVRAGAIVPVRRVPRRRRRVLALSGIGIAVAALLTVALTVDLGSGDRPRVAQVGSARAAATIRLAKLPAATRRGLRRKHILGPALHLLGTPFPGIDLYRGPSQYGTCLVEVNDGHVGGTDCGDVLDDTAPGIASSAFQPTTANPAVGMAHQLKLQFLYGAATSVVHAARLVDRDGTTTSTLPLHSEVPGYVVFGSTTPDPNGEWVELLDTAGTIVQRIQVSE